MITLCLLVCLGSILMDGGLVEGQVGKPECKGRNFPGGRECCESEDTEESKCTEGQGDCDSDVGCAGDLVCGMNNCRDVFGIHGASANDDCCTKPNPAGKPRCKGRNVSGGRECCESEDPEESKCTEGQGDCDSDVGCAGDLVCGMNNCRDVFGIHGASANDDCCTKPNPAGKPRCKGRKVSGGRDCCKSEDPEESKCTEGQGDCDSDDGCKGDLVCGRNNCMEYISGASSSDDCCTTKQQECTQTNSCRAAGLPVGRCIEESSPIPTGVKKASYGRCNDGCQCVKFIKDCVQTDSCKAEGGKCFPNIDLPFLPGLKVVHGECEDDCICKKF